MTISMKTHKISSLKKRDALWIYKHSQGLQLLDDELNERRKKRFARHRASPPPHVEQQQQEKITLSPTSPTPQQIKSIINEKNNQDAFISVAAMITEKKDYIPVAPPRKDITKEILIPVAPLRKEMKRDAVVMPNQQLQQTNSIATRMKALEEETLKSSQSTVTSRKQTFGVKKLTDMPLEKNMLAKRPGSISSPINFIAPVDKKKDRNPIEIFPSAPKRFISTIKHIDKSVSSVTQFRKPVKPEENKKDELITQTVITEEPNTSNAAPTIVTKIEMNKQPTVNSKLEPFARKLPSSPISNHRPTPIKSESSNFLLEVKQRLISAQLQKVATSFPVIAKKATPAKTNGLVSSFVSAYETPNATPPITSKPSHPVNKLTSAPVTNVSPKLPRHTMTMSVSPTSSVSTPPLAPLTMEINNMFPAVSSSSSIILPSIKKQHQKLQKDSYFSTVIDCRFSGSPIQHKPSPPFEDDGEEEEASIQVYLPQLSSDISFSDSSNDLLDVAPSDSETEEVDDQAQRPVIKKRVSFSDQLSTVIPGTSTDDDLSSISSSSITSPIEEDRSTSPMTRFVHKLSHELMDASHLLTDEKKVNSSPIRDKFVPAPIVPMFVPHKKEVLSSKKLVGFGNNGLQPQKLSNKLLDMFQNKKLMQPQTKSAAAVISSSFSNVSSQKPPPLTHLTKTRPRKPASLKKPSTLTYPAAIAQPDWRARVLSTNKLTSSPDLYI